MNILVVNAYGNSEKRKEKFKHYKESIEKIISKVALRLGVENVLYSYRTVEELNDFAYNLPENDKAKDFDKKTYKNNFDKLDLVFIDGYEKDYLPWQTKGKKLYRLIKLCETFQKIILAQGIGMIHLIYYLATNGMEKNIINSSEEYPTIESLDIIPKEFLSNLKVEDIFLDFATGDIFHFNGSDKWEPVGNIGIHKLQYAEKYSNRGKFVLKPFHKSHKEELISITRNDVKVKIGKQVVLHWFLKNLSDEFVAYTSLNWFLHNICVNSKKLQYKVLADSNLGPIILEHQNSIGTIFHLDKDNKETLIMFENFVERSFKEIQKNVWFNRNKRKEDLSSAIFKDYGNNLNYDETQEEVKKLEKLRSFTPMTIVNRSKLYRNIVTKEFEGNHCGCSYNPTEMIFVKNNSVLRQKYPVKKKNVITESYSKEKLKILTEKIMRDDFDYLKPKREAIDELAIEYYKKKQREICEKLDGEKILMESAVNKLTKQSVQNSEMLLTTPSVLMNDSSSKRSSISNTSSSKTNKYSASEKPKKYKTKISLTTGNLSSNFSKKTMKTLKQTKSPTKSPSKKKDTSIEGQSSFAMVFPYIDEEYFKLKEFVPGKDPKKNHLETVRVDLETRLKSNFLKKFKKYDKELNHFRDRPTIRCSSEYVTEDEAKRREFIESKKLWMAKEDFKKVFGKQTDSAREREEYNDQFKYFSRNNTEEKNNEDTKYSVLGYQYRTLDKSKWVCKRDFIV